MISKKYRFHGYGSLKYLFHKGRVVHSRSMTLKYINNPRRRQPRFAVIVSKKVHKSAVIRNRIRRRIYEVIRHQLPKLNPAFDMAFIIHSDSLATVEADQLEQQVVGLLKKAELYFASNNQ